MNKAREIREIHQAGAGSDSGAVESGALADAAGTWGADGTARRNAYGAAGAFHAEPF